PVNPVGVGVTVSTGLVVPAVLTVSVSPGRVGGVGLSPSMLKVDWALGVTLNVSLPSAATSVPSKPLSLIVGGEPAVSSGPAVMVSEPRPRLTVTDAVGFWKSVVGDDDVLEIREMPLPAVGSSPRVTVSLVAGKLNVRAAAASGSKMPRVWLRPL